MHITNHHCVVSLRTLAGLLLLAMPVFWHADGNAAEPMARYNVVWESPSQDASGQMALGNGDVAAGVYVIEDGDLCLLLAKNDAFNYNGDIYKTGRVRISLAPKAGDMLVTNPGDFAGTLSFEAWIRPEKGESGRIVDKITAGKSDGLLVDCWPDQSLRVILSSQQRNFAGVLQAGVWQHVVVVIGRGRLDVYLNGERL